MTTEYRRLMREIAKVEEQFPATKAEKQYLLRRMYSDERINTEEDFREAEHRIGEDYYNQIHELTVRKHRLEEQLRDELERMNTTSLEDQKLNVYRPDGKVDFGRAFLWLAEKLEKVEALVQKNNVKIDIMDRILVDSE